MRTAILFLLCAMPVSGQSFGRTAAFKYAATPMASVGCSIATATAIFDDTGISTASSDEVLPAATFKSARQFTIAGTRTVTHYKINVNDAQDLSSLTLQLYTDNAGAVGTAVTGTDVTISAASIGGAFAVVEFDLASPVQIAAGTYWLNMTTGTGGGFIYAYAASAGINSSFPGASGYITGYTISVGVWACTP